MSKEGAPIKVEDRFKKASKLTALAAAVALTAAGCEPPFKNGTVEDKRHEDPYTYLMFIPLTTCSKDSCTTTLIPYFIFDDEDWVLTLKNCDKIENSQPVCETANLYVTEEIYNDSEIGEYVDFNEKDETLVSRNDPTTRERQD